MKYYMFIKLLNYLFFKYYYWQIKVENKDIAAFGSMLFISFITFLFLITIIIFFVMFVIPKESLPEFLLSKGNVLTLLSLVLISYYFIFFHKKRYKNILKKNIFKR